MPHDFSKPTLYVEHVPDYGIETDGNGVKHEVELPGHVNFGVEIDGVKVQLGRKATAGLLADIERSKAAAEAEKSSGGSKSPPSQG